MRDHDEERRCSAQRMDVGGVFTVEKIIVYRQNQINFGYLSGSQERWLKILRLRQGRQYTDVGKDCDTCSWGDRTIGDVGMCRDG